VRVLAAVAALILVVCPELHASDELLPPRIPDIPSASTEAIAECVVYAMIYKQSEWQRTVFDPTAIRQEFGNTFLEWPDGFFIPDNVFRHEWNTPGMKQRALSNAPYGICDGDDEVKFLQKSWRPPEILKRRRDCSYQRRTVRVFENGEFHLDWIDVGNLQGTQGFFGIFSDPDRSVSRAPGRHSSQPHIAGLANARPPSDRPQTEGREGEYDRKIGNDPIGIGKVSKNADGQIDKENMESGAIVVAVIVGGIILWIYQTAARDRRGYPTDRLHDEQSRNGKREEKPRLGPRQHTRSD
jgi:hypothetical protein